jgi:hypothetical protein
MPHQTRRKMSNNVQVNGEVPHSAFIGVGGSSVPLVLVLKDAELTPATAPA